jgi:hypothetical protein
MLLQSGNSDQVMQYNLDLLTKAGMSLENASLVVGALADKLQFAKTTTKYREEHAVLSGGRFPIHDRAHAISALKLRGHARDSAERKKIINSAARYAPEEAEAARKKDKADGLI